LQNTGDGLYESKDKCQNKHEDSDPKGPPLNRLAPISPYVHWPRQLATPEHFIEILETVLEVPEVVEVSILVG
jgi:hypothetical protein